MPGEELAKGCLSVLVEGFLCLFFPEKKVRIWFTNPWALKQLDAEEQAARELRREKRRAYRQRRRKK